MDFRPYAMCAILGGTLSPDRIATDEEVIANRAIGCRFWFVRKQHARPEPEVCLPGPSANLICYDYSDFILLCEPGWWPKLQPVE